MNDWPSINEYSAYAANALLDEEISPHILAMVAEDLKKQAASRKERIATNDKYENLTTARPPTMDELRGAYVYLDSPLSDLPDVKVLNAVCAKFGCKLTQQPHEATIFVAVNPWAPHDDIIMWTACLNGAWIICPRTLAGSQGASIKYQSPFGTKRKVWVSDGFKNAFPKHWLVLLKALKELPINPFTFLATSVDWARERALAEKKERPAEVLALMSTGEAKSIKGKAHVFDVQRAIEFFARPDPKRGSLGILNM